MTVAKKAQPVVEHPSVGACFVERIISRKFIVFVVNAFAILGNGAFSWNVDLTALLIISSGYLAVQGGVDAVNASYEER